MISQLRPALVMTGAFTVLLGLGYPLAMTGIAQVAMPGQADGSLVVALRARDTAWVRRLALRLGEQGQVLGPAELADEVRADARRALAAYGT